ncbi:MAG: prenyltransferase/squalene oxidase repeat-containing protein [Planctomycetota bacterium JB042]
MTSCAEVRDMLVDLALGEVDADAAAAVAAHRASCAACEREARRTEALLAGVRRLAAPAASPSFRPSLRRRLVAARRAEEDEAVRRASFGERAAAELAFVGHRIRTSTGLRVLLAVAAVHLVGLVVWLVLGAERSDPAPPRGEEVVRAPATERAPPESGAATPEPAAPEEAPVGIDDRPPTPEEFARLEPPLPGDVHVEPPSAPLPSVSPVERAARRPLDPWPADAVREGKELVELDNRRVEFRFRLRDRFVERPDGPADRAVRRGMRWLVQQQDPDGSWDPSPYGGEAEARVGTTALCTLALMANAERGVPGGLHRAAVERAFDYLRTQRLEDGTIGAVRGDDDVVLFNHATATLAFAESWALRRGGDERLLADALERLDDLGSRRRFRERQEADDITAPWVAMALETARAAGVPAAVNLDRAAAGARRFVAKLVDVDPTTGRLLLPGAQLCAIATTSALDPFGDGALDYEAYRPSVELLLTHLAAPSLREPTKIHFAALDLHQRGGVDWARWDEAARETLLGVQHEDGSWTAEYEWDAVQAMGGDLYETALTLMTLSVPQRLAR